MDRLDFALELLTNGSLIGESHLQSVLESRDVSPLGTKSLEKDLLTWRQWVQGDNVVGMGIAEKSFYADEETLRSEQELSLKFYVVTKLPKSKLEGERFIPPRILVPGIGEVLTDVEEIGRVALESLQQRCRPTLGGCSIGHAHITAGTLGCLVRQRKSPHELYVLSNSHVLADGGQGQQGDLVLQPGPHDGGRAGHDVIGQLQHWVPFDFSGLYVNRVDAALAGPVTERECHSEIAFLGSPPLGIQPTIRRGQSVQKVGRTTGHTTGAVIDTRFRTRLDYHGNWAGFVDLALCTRYSEMGDSGALMLDEDLLAIGLHIGGTYGSPDKQRSFFCPIEMVLDALEVDLVTQSLAEAS